MTATVPQIEGPYDTDPLRVGGPHCELHAADAVNGTGMSAEKLMRAPMYAAVERTQSAFVDERREGVGVSDFEYATRIVLPRDRVMRR